MLLRQTCNRTAGVVLILLMAGELAMATPLAVLDRNGSQVSIEGYAPNIVRVTLALDKELALAPPGFGIIVAQRPCARILKHGDMSCGRIGARSP